MPPAAPGVVAQQVERIAVETNLENEIFLGLGVDDWINLGLSVLLVGFGYLIGTWIIRRVLPKAVKKTNIELILYFALRHITQHGRLADLKCEFSHECSGYNHPFHVILPKFKIPPHTL